VTLQLVQSGQIMGIPVLDHIIIAGSRFFSFSKEGLLKS
jgi:DNA repair protein RadC